MAKSPVGILSTNERIFKSGNNYQGIHLSICLKAVEEVLLRSSINKLFGMN